MSNETTRLERFMRDAVAVARRNRKAPFGAVLVDGDSGGIVAQGVNRSDESPIWHAEMDAIDQYARDGRGEWDQLTLFSTAEPCCMCQGAIAWANIPRVVYGTSIAHLQSIGWKQIDITAEQVSAQADFSNCELIGGMLEETCNRLFREASLIKAQ